MSSERQFFTVGEALDQVLNGMVEEFVAEPAEIDSSDDDVDNVVSESENVTSTSALAIDDNLPEQFPPGAPSFLMHTDTGPGIAGGEPELLTLEISSDKEDVEHFLDREVDVTSAASNFIRNVESADRAADVDTETTCEASAGTAAAAVATGAGTGAGAALGSVTAPATAPFSCGCNKNCLAKFPVEAVPKSRLAMMEVEDNERDMFIMGMLLTTVHQKHAAENGNMSFTSIRTMDRWCAVGHFRTSTTSEKSCGAT